jgi:hypothetical protein
MSDKSKWRGNRSRHHAKTKFRIPSREEITADSPLRLSVAAALVFADGSLTAPGLRREAARGRLTVEKIAGKQYTTLANIERMKELCRVEAKGQDSGLGPLGGAKRANSSVGRSGLSSMGVSISPRDALKAKLSGQNGS